MRMTGLLLFTALVVTLTGCDKSTSEQVTSDVNKTARKVDNAFNH